MLRTRGGQSEQINFFNSNRTGRSNQEGKLAVIPMHHGWNSKKVVQSTLEVQDTLNTHDHLFVKKAEKLQPQRARQLVIEE